ncbi:hypothetical protein, partial [Streptomyces sp. 150FB]|uniref:hypothetical protein n=1 Tax=Streptomyces sp. 150FB TaxID=1576605 RepID=UPI0005895F26
LPDPEVRRVLGAAGAEDAEAALVEADGFDAEAFDSAGTVELLRSGEFDPCSLQARPTDLMRRRQHGRAAVAAVAAVVVCGALLGLPGDGWGRGSAAAPSYARNPAAEAALDPAKVRRTVAGAWETSPRTDFSVWPARGDLVHDQGLLRRALAVWARPGAGVRVSATPGTPSGPPMGPPQLLYAGTVDGTRVVLLHDGLRVVRYAEPASASRSGALDFARVDDADAASAAALVVTRSDSNVRYLTAPWVTRASVRDLLDPGAEARPLRRDSAGVTDALSSPVQARACASWDTLDVRSGDSDHLLTDLGELVPARLTSGRPSSPGDVSTAGDRAVWARTACLLPAVRSHGVRSVNSWQYARQALPERGGTASWVCTRADTWQGPGSRVLAVFQPPGAAGAAGAIAAKAEDSPACGARRPDVLAGVLWRARGGAWYLLAAGSPGFTSVAARGAVTGSAKGTRLVVRARAGARAELTGVAGGDTVPALR